MYRLSGVVVLLLGILSLVYSYGSLSLGRLASPGAGLWPFLISMALVVSSVVLLITERDGGDYEAFTARSRFIGIGLLSLVVFIILFAYVGFIIPAFLTLAFWLRFLGDEPWRVTLIVSALCTAGFYGLFVPVLGVPFPEDLLVSLVRS